MPIATNMDLLQLSVSLNAARYASVREYANFDAPTLDLNSRVSLMLEGKTVLNGWVKSMRPRIGSDGEYIEYDVVDAWEWFTRHVVKINGTAVVNWNTEEKERMVLDAQAKYTWNYNYDGFVFWLDEVVLNDSVISEEWTLEFEYKVSSGSDATGLSHYSEKLTGAYKVYGSESGYQGAGNINGDFTTTNGMLTIKASAWKKETLGTMRIDGWKLIVRGNLMKSGATILKEILDTIPKDVIRGYDLDEVNLITETPTSLELNATTYDAVIKELLEKCGKYGAYIDETGLFRIVDFTSLVSKAVIFGERGQAITDNDVIESNLEISLEGAITKATIEGMPKEKEIEEELIPMWNKVDEANYGKANYVGNQDVFRKFRMSKSALEASAYWGEAISYYVHGLSTRNKDSPIKLTMAVPIQTSTGSAPSGFINREVGGTVNFLTGIVWLNTPACYYAGGVLGNAVPGSYISGGYVGLPVKARYSFPNAFFIVTKNATNQKLIDVLWDSEFYSVDSELQYLLDKDGKVLRDDTTRMEELMQAKIDRDGKPRMSGSIRIVGVNLGWQLGQKVTFQKMEQPAWADHDARVYGITYNPGEKTTILDLSSDTVAGIDVWEMRERQKLNERVKKLEAKKVYVVGGYQKGAAKPTSGDTGSGGSGGGGSDAGGTANDGGDGSTSSAPTWLPGDTGAPGSQGPIGPAGPTGPGGPAGTTGGAYYAA